MNCPNCGNVLPEGSSACPYCGAPVTDSQPAFTMAENQPVYDAGEPAQPMYEDSYNAPYSQPIQAQAVAKKQPPKSAIIIGAVALVAIAAIIVFLFLGGNTSKYNGTYDLDTVSYLGMEFPAEDFTNEEAYIKIKGDKATLRAEGEDTRTATIKIDGEDVKITDGEDTIKGKYDADEKTITIEMEGIGMTFKKR